MLVIVLHGVQVRQHQRRRVTGGHHRDVSAVEAVDVLADARDQPVDQAGEPEQRAGLHALDGVLADHRARPHQLDAAQRRRTGRRGIRGDLNTGSDCPTQEFALGRDHVHTDRGTEVDDDGRGAELRVGREAVHDPVGADLLGVVDQQWDTGAHTGFDQDVRRRRPVLLEHDPHLVQHRRHRREPGGAGEPFGVVTDETLDGQREFVGGDLGFGADAPVLGDLRVIAGAGDQADDGVGVADVDGEQHGYPTARAERNPAASWGTWAGSSPRPTGRLWASTNTTRGRYCRALASSMVA